MIDIAVVGAGPCGVGVGAAASKAGLSCTLFDKSCVVSSISGYPTFMTFFSTPEKLEIAGVPFVVVGEKPTRREALRYYQRVVRKFDVDVRQYVRVDSVEKIAGGFRLTTTHKSGEAGSVDAKHVVIATGYFDSPNMLGVPGEDLPKVAHSYREGHTFFDQDVVVIGGANSAVDAALEIHSWGARVTMVHFAEYLDQNVKPWVLPEIAGRIREGDIAARWRSRIVEIKPKSVIIRSDVTSQLEEIRNDWVLAMTGYMPRRELLVSLGVEFDEETGIPAHDTDTMETNVSKVYIAGVITAGNNANKIFIENGRDHGPRIVEAIRGK
ncbi:MAG TPA: YpdA family putative bacillithiol disulfide reductase [Longimicrobiales bacterium]|nr:YpdA family putative bacillithiol disulfide reductase [Longimicrobiales bacterium]